VSEKLIVRLSGRGQYEIGSDSADVLAELNVLDNQIVSLLTRTELELQALLEQMTASVEAHGSVVQDTLAPSNLILPPGDLTLAEATQLFEGEGLIPG
jgi:uncharacterized protein YegL